MRESALDRTAKIAEIVGAIAVVVGLSFVGLEVRDNTRAQRFSTTQTLIRDYNDGLRSFLEAEMACVLMKGYEAYASLDALEKIEFSSQLADTFRAQGLRDFSEARDHWFGSRFRGYVDGLVADVEPMSGYHGLSGCND